MKIKNFKVEADYFMSVIPVVSILNNAIDLAIKTLISYRIIGPDAVNKSAYLKHLKQKSYGKTALYAIPLIGNYYAAKDYNAYFMKTREWDEENKNYRKLD